MILPDAGPALLPPILAAITFQPNPIAFQLGPIPVYWYGLAYMVGLAATYFVITREAQRRGLDARLVDNGIIVVAVAALAGGRLYHVIDQWPLYQDNLLRIVLPPYTGLGVYGGIFTGTVAAYLFTRWARQPFWKWADVIVPGLFVMQAIGRWGNFFNQELYGPPTNLPWAITISCANRVAAYPCTTYPEATTAFHPLFLYESLSGIVGAVTLLWLARRIGPRLRPGDLALLFFAWYAVVRFALEFLRTDNWTVGGIPVATIVSAAVFSGALAVFAWRHRPSAAVGDRWDDWPETEDDDWGDDDDWDDADDRDEADGDPEDEADADGDAAGPADHGRVDPR
jgi:phosphatidylglycerol:prolipoprotein diacylglycerol transferase